MRYFGPSQMSLFKLFIHSLSIVAVCKYRVLFSSLVLLVLLYCLEILLKFNLLSIQIPILLFNFFVFVVSFRESEKELENSQIDIASIENFTH